MDVPPIPDRVQAGVELLDRELPGWEHRIDLSDLDMSSGCGCVLGQLFSAEWASALVSEEDDPYHYALRQLHELDCTQALAFDVLHWDDEDLVEADYERLTAAWRNRIEARRATKAAV